MILRDDPNFALSKSCRGGYFENIGLFENVLWEQSLLESLD